MTDLITRLSKLDAPDSEVDMEIAETLGIIPEDYERAGAYGKKLCFFWHKNNHNAPHISWEFTSSIDDAIALVGMVLPGWNWLRPERDIMAVHHEDHSMTFFAVGATPAIALCIAILRAKEASNA